MNILLANNLHIFPHQLPPQNTLAEEIILGSLLNNRITIHNTITKLRIDFFALEIHQVLYIYIIAIYNKYNYIHVIKLIYLLWAEQKLQKIGGLIKIINLMQHAQLLLPSYQQNQHIEEYIQIIYCHYIRRKFLQYSYNIIQLCYIKNLPLQKLYEKSISYLDQIAKSMDLKQDKTLKNLISNLLLTVHSTSITSLANKNNIIFSGLQELDKITNGLKEGDLIVVAGRPSMGKTSLAINLTKYMLLELNLKVHIFSLEMSKIQILSKIISIACNIPTKYIQSGQIKQQSWQCIHTICRKLLTANLYIDDEANASINYIKSQIQLTDKYIKKNK